MKVFVSVLLISLSFLSILCPVLAENALSDSGIDYKEIVETVENPGAGYSTIVGFAASPGNTPVITTSGSLVLLFIDIGAFSSGVNGKGEDILLDDNFFSQMRKSLDYARKAGSMVAMRFRYDSNGVSNPEPATFDFVFQHIKQLKDSGMFEDYKDIIALLESGFIGQCGEQHHGKYESVEDKARLLDGLLNSIPESIPITVRTPDTFAEWAGIDRSQLDNSTLFEQASKSSDPMKRRILTHRVGLFNDGYMGSINDLGTFSNRELETNWLGKVTPDTYYGGEFSGDQVFARSFDTYKPENAIPEMYKTHLSYINGNIFPFYREFTFTQAIADLINADNSAYLGQDAFTFIRDHLGYRFVLRKCELTQKIKQGDILKVKFRVENTGFSAPVPHTKGYIILEKDDVYIKSPIDLDTHFWDCCTVNETELNIKIPDHIKTGKWRVYLKEMMGGYSDEMAELAFRSIRFANKGVWNSVLAANYLGTVEVGKSDGTGTDNSFYEKSSKTKSFSSDEFFDSSIRPVVDGAISSESEWTDASLVHQDGDNYLHVRTDEKYLYVMAHLPNNAVSPVNNLALQLAKNEGTRYWLYYAANINPYFSHENYTGCDCKWKNGVIEFRVPYTWLNINPNETQFKSVSVFIQDMSLSGWPSVGSISLENFNVTSEFVVYTVEKDVAIQSGKDYTLRVRTPVEGVRYKWLKDGTALPNGSSDTYKIVSATSADKGSYSVVLSSDYYDEKEVKVANVLVVTDEVELSSACVSAISNCLLMAIMALLTVLV